MDITLIAQNLKDVQGDTLEEVFANMKEAIEFYLETLSENEARTLLSKEILTTSLEVRIG